MTTSRLGDLFAVSSEHEVLRLERKINKYTMHIWCQARAKRLRQGTQTLKSPVYDAQRLGWST